MIPVRDSATFEQIAANVGTHPMTLTKWLRRTRVNEGDRPGVQSVVRRTARCGVADPVAGAGERGVRRAGAYLSQANISPS